MTKTEDDGKQRSVDNVILAIGLPLSVTMPDL